MGKHKSLAIGIAYFSFGFPNQDYGNYNSLLNSVYSPQIVIGKDKGIIQDNFQNGFHKVAGMNLLEILKNKDRNQKEGTVIQFGTGFGYN